MKPISGKEKKKRIVQESKMRQILTGESKGGEGRCAADPALRPAVQRRCCTRGSMSGLLSGLVQSIINRYLQKWLKNVTTEHATIWGGEMVFKNVELRLDVLQEELGLPLVFTRGFIQELRVYVPLASLLRESIKFTLTNLEIVASTPTDTAPRGATPKKETKSGSRHSPGQGPAQRVRPHSEVGEKQPGWVHSVVQKVLQNIGIEVRNLVFKYHTASYVSSVSWKALSLVSSNDAWEPVFAKPEGETRAIYKRLQVDDITWSLDAVDAAGGLLLWMIATVVKNVEAVDKAAGNCVCVCVCSMDVRTYACMHACMYHTHTHTLSLSLSHTHIHMHACMHACIQVSIYIHTHTHTHTHTHARQDVVLNTAVQP